MEEAEFLERLDKALSMRENDPNQISSEALIRRCYPIIKKYQQKGFKLEAIAAVLQEMGFNLNKGHLVRGLGKIEKGNSDSQIELQPELRAELQAIPEGVGTSTSSDEDPDCWVEIDGEKFDLRLDMPVEFSDQKNIRKSILWRRAYTALIKSKK
ncbi:MAG: hypothetical protein ACYC3O_07240 [Burkholderiales bacterium]